MKDLGVPATPSGCQPSASNLRFSRSGIPNAVLVIDDWCKDRAAKLTERSNVHIRTGRRLDDPDYRALLGEHRAYLAVRSFIHGALTAEEASNG